MSGRSRKSRVSGPLPVDGLDLERAFDEDEILQAKYTEYAQILIGEPRDRIWFSVAQAFDLKSDGRRTIGALRIACQLNPDWGRYHLELAKAWLRAGKSREARHEIDRCADLDNSGCDTSFYAESDLYYLGFALFRETRYKEASEAWRGADNVVQYWHTPEPLKDFHLNRGWAHHLEGDYIGAREAYHRGLVAPGPGDCSEDDDMDPDLVEEAQSMNARIEVYYDMARAAQPLDAKGLEAVPYTAS